MHITYAPKDVRKHFRYLRLVFALDKVLLPFQHAKYDAKSSVIIFSDNIVRVHAIIHLEDIKFSQELWSKYVYYT